MKKYLALSAAVLGLASAAQAFAPTAFVYVNGSTATRTDVYYALCKTLSPTTGFAVKGAHGDNQFTFEGTWPNDGSGLANTAVEIFYSANGSATGINHVCIGDLVDYIDINGVAFRHVATAAFSDVFQTTTSVGCGLSETSVAVITFTFAVNTDPKAAKIKNVTQQNMLSIGSTGTTTLDLFTGVAADAATTVYLTGRDNGSGTRITTLAETGYGVFTPIFQWRNHAYTVNADDSKTQGGALANWVAWGNDPGFPQQDNGWSSGGGVKGDLQNAANGPGIGYVGLNDTPGAGQQVNYSGYAFSPAAVQQAQYTLWGYEHLDAGADADAQNFQSAMPGALSALLEGGVFGPACDGGTYTPGAATLDLNSMQCVRGADGAQVQHL